LPASSTWKNTIGVDADHGVVLGDDLLPRNVEHLLHHVDLVAHPVDERDDEVQARLGGQRVLAQPFDGVDIALPHDAHAHQQESGLLRAGKMRSGSMV
jgi:hypothetical protein